MHFANPAHVDHDALLIAGHAAGDLAATQNSAARTLIATCSDCAALHEDLVAISAAARALPHEIAAPRDFRLSTEQAQRLQGGSWLRTLLRPFAAAQSVTRPLATAFTSLGAAGLLVALVGPAVMGGMGGAASAPMAERQNQPAAEAPAPAPTSAPALDPLSGPNAAAASAQTGKSDVATEAPGFQALGGEDSGQQAGSGEGALDGATDDSGARLETTAAPANLLVLGSVGLLLAGLLLFGLRAVARRLR